MKEQDNNTKRKKQTKNGDTEIQKRILTPFFINSDFLGCDSGTSAEYRSQWGSQCGTSLVRIVLHSKRRIT